jgi:hypothetical protein
VLPSWMVDKREFGPELCKPETQQRNSLFTELTRMYGMHKLKVGESCDESGHLPIYNRRYPATYHFLFCLALMSPS